MVSHFEAATAFFEYVTVAQATTNAAKKWERRIISAMATDSCRDRDEFVPTKTHSESVTPSPFGIKKRKLIMTENDAKAVVSAMLKAAPMPLNVM